jgi:hypothetical protein
MTRNPVSLALLCLLASGCTSAPIAEKRPAEPGSSPARVLEQRAVARWNLLIAGKAAEAYDYLSPGYRALKTREQYALDLKDRPVRWKGASFGSVDCPPPGEYCDVIVEVDYELQSTLPGVGTLKSKGPVTERWIEVDGVWYLVPKEVARE